MRISFDVTWNRFIVGIYYSRSTSPSRESAEFFFRSRILNPTLVFLIPFRYEKSSRGKLFFGYGDSKNEEITPPDSPMRQMRARYFKYYVLLFPQRVNTVRRLKKFKSSDSIEYVTSWPFRMFFFHSSNWPIHPGLLHSFFPHYVTTSRKLLNGLRVSITSICDWIHFIFNVTPFSSSFLSFLSLRQPESLFYGKRKKVRSKIGVCDVTPLNFYLPSNFHLSFMGISF